MASSLVRGSPACMRSIIACTASVVPSVAAPTAEPLASVLASRSSASFMTCASLRLTNCCAGTPSSFATSPRPRGIACAATSNAAAGTAPVNALPTDTSIGCPCFCCSWAWRSANVPVISSKLGANAPTPPPITAPTGPARAPSLAPVAALAAVAPIRGSCSARASGICRPTSPMAPITPRSSHAFFSRSSPVWSA